MIDIIDGTAFLSIKEDGSGYGCGDGYGGGCGDGYGGGGG